MVERELLDVTVMAKLNGSEDRSLKFGIFGNTRKRYCSGG